MSIDAQGFNAGNIKSDVKAVAGKASAMKGLESRVAHSSNLRIDPRKVAKTAIAAEDDRLNKKLNTFNKIGKISNKLFMGDMLLGGAGGMVAGYASRKGWGRVGTVIHAATKGFFEALHTTTLRNILEFPANYVKSIQRHAQAAGGKADAWAEKLSKTGRKLEVSAKRTSRSIGKHTEPALKSVGESVERGVDSFSKNTLVGVELEKGAEKFAGWNAGRSAASHVKHLNLAEEAMTKEAPGIGDSIKNFFTRKKPATTPVHPDLHEFASHLTNAKNAVGEEVITHMNLAQKSLNSVSQSTAKKLAMETLAESEKPVLETLSAQLKNITGSFEHSLHSAKIANGLGEAKGLAGMGKSLMKSAGNLKLFPAIVALTGAAAVGAIVLTHKKEAREADHSLDDIKADLGGDANNPLLKNIEGLHASGKSKRRLSTGISVTGEVVNTALFMAPHAGMGTMMAASAIPAISGMFIHENPVLNAHANLKMEEEGKQALDPVQKLNFIKQMVATTPALMDKNGKELNGGIFNRLVEPVAQEIIARKLTVEQTMKLLGDAKAFTALAAEVQEKHKTAAPSAEKAPETKIVKMAPEASKETSHTPAEAAHHAAEKPGTKVVQIQHEGQLATLHKAVSA